MCVNHEELIPQFRSYLKKMADYHSAIALLEWDARTHMPKNGIVGRSQAIATLSGEAFRMSVSEQMEQFLDQLGSHTEQLDPITLRLVEESQRTFDRSKKIPPDRYEAFVALTSEAQSVWEVARENNDFATFAPFLESIVDMTREFVDDWGYENHPYDTLLDQYEVGMTVSILDELFSGLRKDTVSLLNKIEAKPHIHTEILERFYDPEKQKAFSEFILREMGYDFQSGRLDETAHPFATGIAPGDVRITTHYYPHFFNAAMFGSIHEGGHALYEQGISSDLIGTPLHMGTSMGIHESQSRFWENTIGRSYEFWQCYYGDLQSYFPESLGDVTLDEFYSAINAVRPSLIRIEADEVTYNLHIMLRYEMEKGLIANTLSVKDLPELWHESMKTNLGVTPRNDAEGVLQDVHWSGGMFGYFPSYALGNIYAAQFTQAIERDLPDFKDRIKHGRLLEIREWLGQNIHQYGSLLKPAEILKQATGETIDAKPLVSYLQQKFSGLYHL
ncbi:carboxypeptidase M32 [Sulfoacidibacillus ferrooxidans]|uniref:Metal-dependent carboxypeptidase n=1 Tax=Sulfoacidibacillus ferrooxidans TaxID=2005001 RepID=A0A9X1V8P2_9BACL|nr:carboxypeptidase M32 [Sulfoacidibacillus ferrooxidans]MCI0183314.1 Carboxypeptidase 1 [Sulfoacidibacillus ferrooxidans]